MASSFLVTGHFEISALNDPKMTLNTERSKIPHINITTTHVRPSAKCTTFSCMANPFRVIGHFETSALDDSKMPLNTKRSKIPHAHSITTPGLSPEFYSLCLHGQLFLSYRTF